MDAHPIHDVLAFNRQFNVPMANEPSLLCEELKEYRIKFLAEEFLEFKSACEQENLADAADALVDLIYVAYGTALMMGLPWQAMWALVHRKNMQKVLTIRPEDSKRGSQYDVIKPEGWTPPDYTMIIGSVPWPTFNPLEQS